MLISAEVMTGSYNYVTRVQYESDVINSNVQRFFVWGQQFKNKQGIATCNDSVEKHNV